ncbi:right-handed parallel beta-helix repeat-containing protein, partial [Calditrichota bacterium]
KSISQTLRFCTVIMMAVSPVFAVTHNVPDEFDSIQAGLDASESGDTVLVQAGTYVENLDWPTVNGIKLIAAGDSSNTFIDGNHVDHVITMSSEGVIDTTTLVQGFTIRNGRIDDDNGGGIYCDWSSPTISNCTISENYAFSHGGGIYCEGSSPTITNCTITGNNVDYDGGGIYCDQSNPTINNCTITGNSANHGGGICCLEGSSPTISNCTIRENLAFVGGGGICCLNGSNPTISNCTITGNSVDYEWGVVGGGGICCSSSDPTISNCTIIGNSTDVYGGGIVCVEGSSPSISNCAVTDNTGEGIYVDSSCSAETNYSNIYNNSEGDFGGPDIDPDLGVIVDTNANGDSCDVYFNIFLAPMYVDPDNGDYHLQEDSPCIDAGDPDSSLDPDGTIADIGAFYYDQDLFVPDFTGTELPGSYSISAAYPNPFNPSTNVTVSLPSASRLSVKVFNTLGQQVAALANSTYDAGFHNFTFDGSGMASDIYLVKAEVPGKMDEVRKVVLVK